MSRKTIEFVRRWKQARGSNNTIEFGRLVRMPLRSNEAAFNIILPEDIDGRKVAILHEACAKIERF
jgi:hypothetical protein